MADNICLSVRRAGGLERWGNTGRERQGCVWGGGAEDGADTQRGPTDQKALPLEDVGDSPNTAPPPPPTSYKHCQMPVHL